MRILIVDDEPIILGGLVKVIGGAAPVGAEIREAGDAFEALQIMKEYMPDVTVTDLHMPEKNGFEMMEEAKENGLCERFIILTGHDDFEYARRALRYGVVDYLLKPVDKEEVARLLSQVNRNLPSLDSTDCPPHAKRILAYTRLNYMNDLSLDHLAELMHLHPNYISSLFKKVTGDTFVNYLNTTRIKEAQKLLSLHRDLPVGEIGRRVGYENKHYFNKVFKKYTGSTPGAYREDH
ncbi:response regulator [Paenibacillus sp. FSL K6-1217]|uniref:response regulator transcription factor n=1 Tax=Paenibacillus sp. FSL K6-1217 TaxID=2921466 RepID=UPI003252CB29